MGGEGEEENVEGGRRMEEREGRTLAHGIHGGIAGILAIVKPRGRFPMVIVRLE